MKLLHLLCVLTLLLLLLSCRNSSHVFISGESGRFSYDASCKYTGTGTYTAYVAVRTGSRLLSKTAVDQGYDTMADCEKSSVLSIEVADDGSAVIVKKPDGGKMSINVSEVRPAQPE